MPKPKQISFRCPECGQLSHDSARVSSVLLLCDRCGHEVARSNLVEGEDEICVVEPEPTNEDSG
jgi:ribosomal protein L37AE/L43A